MDGKPGIPVTGRTNSSEIARQPRAIERLLIIAFFSVATLGPTNAFSQWKYQADASCDGKPGKVHASTKFREDVTCGETNSQPCIWFQLSPEKLECKAEVYLEYSFDRKVYNPYRKTWKTVRSYDVLHDFVEPKEMYKYIGGPISSIGTGKFRDRVENVQIEVFNCFNTCKTTDSSDSARRQDDGKEGSSRESPSRRGPEPDCSSELALVEKVCSENDNLDYITLLREEFGPSPENTLGCIAATVGRSFSKIWDMARAKSCGLALNRCHQTTGCKKKCDEWEPKLNEYLEGAGCRDLDDALRFVCLDWDRSPQGTYEYCSQDGI